MTPWYVDTHGFTIRDAEDHGQIADLLETVDPQDARAMAAGPWLVDAIRPIADAIETASLAEPEHDTLLVPISVEAFDTLRDVLDRVLAIDP